MSSDAALGAVLVLAIFITALLTAAWVVAVAATCLLAVIALALA